jgi:outer membrane protein assembly factor BamA
VDIKDIKITGNEKTRKDFLEKEARPPTPLTNTISKTIK